MPTRRRSSVLLLSALVVAAGTHSAPAFAQCALCGLSTGGGGAVRALFHGVLVLLIPVAGILAGFAYLTWRFRK